MVRGRSRGIQGGLEGDAALLPIAAVAAATMLLDERSHVTLVGLHRGFTSRSQPDVAIIVSRQHGGRRPRQHADEPHKNCEQESTQCTGSVEAPGDTYVATREWFSISARVLGPFLDRRRCGCKHNFNKNGTTGGSQVNVA